MNNIQKARHDLDILENKLNRKQIDWALGEYAAELLNSFLIGNLIKNFSNTNNLNYFKKVNNSRMEINLEMFFEEIEIFFRVTAKKAQPQMLSPTH